MTYIRIDATFVCFNIAVLNTMTLIVTRKLQNLQYLTKQRNVFGILLGGRHKDFAPAPRIAFLTQK